MKNPFVCISLALLTAASPALAERTSAIWGSVDVAGATITLIEDAANPFVKKPAIDQQLPPPGPSFASLVENFLVPPELLDDWLRDHPLKDDATELRVAVQGWVTEGKAQSDHSTLTLGTAGRESESDSIIEKMYPTEFEPGGVGAWPWPTSFDTRNLGHTLGSGVTRIDGSESLWMNWELVEMISSDSSQPLIEQTRQPGDTFLPRIRSMNITQQDPNAPREDPDPFKSNSEKSPPVDFTKPRGVVFTPGVYHLAGRLDPLPEDDSTHKATRLVFYRGEIADNPKNDGSIAPDPTRATIHMVRVSLPMFSSWMLDHSPISATTEAWAQAEFWSKDGNAENLGELSSTVREAASNTVQNILEHIYATEVKPSIDTTLIETWEEGKKQDGKDGVATMSRYKITPRPGLDGAGFATAFDTRNIGTTLETVIHRDGSGFLVRSKYERVRLLGDSIIHRIKVDDKWIPDIKMPLFSSTLLSSTIRVAPGQWTLLGSISEFLPTEKVDREHCLLVFVKVD